jgi:hypothetical protein
VDKQDTVIKQVIGRELVKFLTVYKNELHQFTTTRNKYLKVDVYDYKNRKHYTECAWTLFQDNMIGHFGWNWYIRTTHACKKNFTNYKDLQRAYKAIANELLNNQMEITAIHVQNKSGYTIDKYKLIEVVD